MESTIQNPLKSRSRTGKGVNSVINIIKRHIKKILLMIITPLIGATIGYFFHIEPDFHLYSSTELVKLSKGKSNSLNLIIENCSCIKKYNKKISLDYYCPEKRIEIVEAPLVGKCPDKIPITLRYPSSEDIRLGQYYLDCKGTGQDNNVKRDRIIIVIQSSKEIGEPPVFEGEEGIISEGRILSPKPGVTIMDSVDVEVEINLDDPNIIYWIAVRTKNLYWPKGRPFTDSDLVDRTYKTTFNEIYYAPEVEIVLLKVDEKVNQYFMDWTELQGKRI